MMRRIVGRGGDLAVERTVGAREPDATAQRDDEAPGARSAKQPMDSGIGIATLRPVAGSKRLSEGALMSTQYSTFRRRPYRAFAEACLAVEHAREWRRHRQPGHAFGPAATGRLLAFASHSCARPTMKAMSEPMAIQL